MLFVGILTAFLAILVYQIQAAYGRFLSSKAYQEELKVRTLKKIEDLIKESESSHNLERNLGQAQAEISLLNDADCERVAELIDLRKQRHTDSQLTLLGGAKERKNYGIQTESGDTVSKGQQANGNGQNNARRGDLARTRKTSGDTATAVKKPEKKEEQDENSRKAFEEMKGRIVSLEQSNAFLEKERERLENAYKYTLGAEIERLIVSRDLVISKLKKENKDLEALCSKADQTKVALEKQNDLHQQSLGLLKQELIKLQELSKSQSQCLEEERERIRAEYEGKLQKAESEISQLASEYRDLSKKTAELEASKKRIEDDHTRATQEVELAASKHRKELEEISLRHSMKEKECEQLQSNLSKLNSEITSLKVEIDLKNELVKGTEELRELLAEMKAEAEERQSSSVIFVKESEEKVGQITHERDELAHKVKSLESTLADTQEEVAAKENLLNEKEAEISETKKFFEELRNSCKELQCLVSQLESALDDERKEKNAQEEKLRALQDSNVEEKYDSVNNILAKIIAEYGISDAARLTAESSPESFEFVKLDDVKERSEEFENIESNVSVPAGQHNRSPEDDSSENVKPTDHASAVQSGSNSPKTTPQDDTADSGEALSRAHVVQHYIRGLVESLEKTRFYLTERESSIKRLSDKTEELERALNASKTAAQEAADRSRALQTSLEQELQDKERLQEEVARLEADVIENNRSIEQLKKGREAAEKELAATRSELAASQEELTAIKEELDNASRSLISSSQSEGAEPFKQQLQDSLQKIDLLTKQASSLQHENNLQILNYQSRAADLAAQLDKANKKIEKQHAILARNFELLKEARSRTASPVTSPSQN